MNQPNQSTVADSGATRDQNNRKIAFGLGLFAAAVFLSIVLRQWFANN